YVPVPKEVAYNMSNQIDWDEALVTLIAVDTFASDPDGCEEPNHWVGMVHPTAAANAPVGGIGAGPPLPMQDLVVTMSTANPTPWNNPYGGTALAHELGHNLGRSH